jgi:hypothetical protein
MIFQCSNCGKFISYAEVAENWYKENPNAPYKSLHSCSKAATAPMGVDE